MGRVYTDTEKMIEATRLSNNGHYNKAASILHNMGNEQRNPEQKKALWETARNLRIKGE